MKRLVIVAALVTTACSGARADDLGLARQEALHVCARSYQDTIVDPDTSGPDHEGKDPLANCIAQVTVELERALREADEMIKHPRH
jgi:hypothetical protein